MAVFEPLPRPWRVPDSAAAGDLFAALAAEPVEVLAFVYLASDQRLLGMRHARSLSVDTHALPIRDVVRDALAFGASGVVMAHNHPSGDPAPSLADRDATRMLARALDPIGVRLLDHLVVAAQGITSFRALGLL